MPITIQHGVCSWTDETLDGIWYPKSVCKSAVDRLQYYSKHFPMVEVDSSNYAIPPADRVSRWIQATPKGFIFHFKVFQLFTAQQVDDVHKLPVSVKAQLPEALLKRNGPILLKELDEDLVESIWSAFNHCLRPAIESGRMGVVLFQMSPAFTFSEENMKYLRQCRAHLDKAAEMAVEFRNSSWLSPQNLPTTVSFLTELKACLVGVDEVHEGKLRYPIILNRTADYYIYIRIHRRVGTDRLLDEKEMSAWVERINMFVDTLINDGIKDFTINFLWNTNWADHSVKNSKRFTEMAKCSKLASKVNFCSWEETIKQQDRTKGIAGMFAKLAASSSAKSMPVSESTEKGIKPEPLLESVIIKTEEGQEDVLSTIPHDGHHEAQYVQIKAEPVDFIQEWKEAKESEITQSLPKESTVELKKRKRDASSDKLLRNSPHKRRKLNATVTSKESNAFLAYFKK